MHSVQFDPKLDRRRAMAALRRPLVTIAALLLAIGPLSAALSGQEIVDLARRRHASPDTTLMDYRSRQNTLVSVGFITDRLAPPKLIVASELASGVAWQQDAGLQVKMLGQRYVTSFGREVEAGLDFSRPWFVPTTPGDSLRLLGGIDIPNRAAVHPFAPGAERFYTYQIGDTVTLYIADREVALVEVKVTPTRGDEALVVGSLWVDGATGDVGAMQIRFVGKPLWDADDEGEAEWANRILSVTATMQQGLWERRYWLPHRQEVELMVRIPFIGNLAIPVVFRNEFDRYEINTGAPIAWVSPDSTRAGEDESSTYDEGATLWLGERREVETAEVPDSARGPDAYPRRESTQVRAGPAYGGWEIIRPPDDTLLAYDEWDRPLEQPASELTLPSAEELERRAQELAPDIVGRRMFSFQYDRLPEMIRYNRVEALGIGLSARYDLPRRPFWSVGGGIGFGVADLGLKGKLDIRYDAPRKRFDLAGYSELHLGGTTLTDQKRANGSAALRAFFLGRDDADYYRASGAALTFGKRWGRMNGRVGAGWEYHSSVERNTQVAIPGIWEDSVFPPNPPVSEGGFLRGDLATKFFLGDWTRPTNRAELTLGLEGGTDTDSLDYVQPRVALEGRIDFGNIAAVAFETRGGWTAGDAPFQRLRGIGGLATVRGFTYGTQRGDSYWTGRLELSPRRKAITPVLFGDVGWAGLTEDWPGSEPLWSFGVGASFLWGVLRTDFVFPKAKDVWFELYFAGSL
ncbi:MAG: hypothetical protein PVJ43_01200 [Gemmatimonadales bacterium]